MLVACFLAWPFGIAWFFGMAISFSLSDYWVRSPGSFLPLEALRLSCEACASDLNRGLEGLCIAVDAYRIEALVKARICPHV